MAARPPWLVAEGNPRLEDPSPHYSLGTASSPCPASPHFSFQPLQEATRDEPVEPQETGAAGSKSRETAAHGGEALQQGEKLTGGLHELLETCYPSGPT